MTLGRAQRPTRGSRVFRTSRIARREAAFLLCDITVDGAMVCVSSSIASISRWRCLLLDARLCLAVPAQTARLLIFPPLLLDKGRRRSLAWHWTIRVRSPRSSSSPHERFRVSLSAANASAFSSWRNWVADFTRPDTAVVGGWCLICGPPAMSA